MIAVHMAKEEEDFVTVETYLENLIIFIIILFSYVLAINDQRDSEPE